MKADKNRQRLAESYSKASHTQRSEAAQDRREKKRRVEKDRMMAEEDPDRQRKLEVCILDWSSAGAHFRSRQKPALNLWHKFHF